MTTQTQDFEPEARNFMNAFYLAHPRKPKTDDEKITLLEEITGGYIPNHFENKADLRKAYEFVYLIRQGIIRE